MNLQDIMIKIRDVVYPEYYKDQEKIDELGLELESCQIDLLSSESQLLDLLTDYNDLQDEHSECGLEASTDIDTFCKANYKQISNIAYKEKRKSPLGNHYSVFLNELVQPSAFEVKNLFKRANLTTDTYKSSRTVGNIVARSVVWTDDKNLATSGDYYLYPSETIIDKKGDCEDHTFIAMSAHPEIGGAWGFYKGGGHAFNVFVYENRLYVLETTGSRAEILEYEKQSDYVIHYIITRDNTYQLKGGVRFGDIAGWY